MGQVKPWPVFEIGNFHARAKVKLEEKRKRKGNDSPRSLN